MIRLWLYLAALLLLPTAAHSQVASARPPMLGTGLSNGVGACNTGAQQAVGKIVPQGCSQGYAGNHTVILADGVLVYAANAVSTAVTFALPRATSVGDGVNGTTYCFTDWTHHGYTLTTTTSAFIGARGLGGSSQTFPADTFLCARSDGADHWSLGVSWGDASRDLQIDTQPADSIFAVTPADARKLVYRTNHAGQADTIAGFAAGDALRYFSVPQGNSLNPQGGATLNGVAGYTFGTNQGTQIFFDGINYRAIIGLPMPASQDSTQVLSNDNIYRQVGAAQLAPGAVTTPALASGLNLTSPSLILGSDAAGDLYMRGITGQVTRLGVGAANAVLAVVAGTCTTDSNNVTTCAPNLPAYQTTLSSSVLPLATNATNGVGRPDGSSVTIDAGGTYHAAVNIDSVASNITALGTSQANCAPLSSRASYISVVAPGSGVCMPGLVTGAHYFVCNKTTTPVLVYAPADGSVISTPSTGALAPTQAISVGRGCPEFIAESTSSLWVTGAGVPLIIQ